jgi:uncharacterized protein (TIGR03118 family)
MIDNSANNAVYYGCALNARAATTTPLLYVANFRSGAIEIYDTNYKPATLPGSFADPSVPAGYAPFNIQQYGGKLYVMYAQQSAGKGAWVAGSGLGAVAVFDTNGNLIKHLVTGGPLNAPWGVAIAPANFGAFSGALLIGNFGDGAINAFDATAGTLLGTLADPQGNPIRIPGLWGLIPGTAAAAVTTRRSISWPAARSRITACWAASRQRRWLRPTPSATQPAHRPRASRPILMSASTARTFRRLRGPGPPPTSAARGCPYRSLASALR